eukprot:CAMPEP_0182927070 /NCGR_PEP_ID=MMETSP0105_2-20130417/13101_1 /TAXON_ID=81532 ORGANISM="Acanthoeca-like sp., Strain 10tr" /NCGR_SAMPLE_ID=MMETSP0105_2 /ASSEMBLY_ACC=CAM_ASM_000205 /LENGTH=243 /DNA_ID=CAMNT_0025064997 /DNA_START=28 /DNA_END=755 /DNA_ORIENTATION=+
MASSAHETVRLMRKASEGGLSSTEFRNVREVKRELTRLHRQLIDEEDEEALLHLFRETKRLKKVLEGMLSNETTPIPPVEETALDTKQVSAEGLLVRSMYFPDNLTDGLNFESSSDSVRHSLVNEAAMVDPSQLPLPLPPPPQFSDDSLSAGDAGAAAGAAAVPPPPPVDNDVLSDLDSSQLAKFDSVYGHPSPGADGAEYFVCCQCQKEGFGEMDERDGNFYCNECWADYMGVGADAANGGG